MSTDTPTPGSTRQDIYKFLEANGFKLTEERHKALRTLIKANANALSEELMDRLDDTRNKLFRREKALGVRHWDTSIPIMCKTLEQHNQNGCYFAECPMKKLSPKKS